VSAKRKFNDQAASMTELEPNYRGPVKACPSVDRGIFVRVRVLAAQALIDVRDTGNNAPLIAKQCESWLG